MSLVDYEPLVKALVRDDRALLSPAEIDVAIDLAVKRYSSDRPRMLVEDVAATDPDSNSLDLPLAWESDFSQLAAMEFPIGEHPVSVVEANHYQLYQSPSGIEVLVDFFAVSDNVRLTFTTRHQLTVALDTIPVGQREAVSCWAAAFLCDQLSSFYAGESDSTISADQVSSSNQSRDFSFRAKTLRARYLSELGVDEKRSAPAGVVVDMDLKNSLGQNRLQHSNRFR